MNVFKGTLLRISQTDTLPRCITKANLDPSAENTISGCWRPKSESSETLRMGIEMRVTKEKFVPSESEW